VAHYDDMQELLADVARLRNELEKQYEAARTDPEVKTVLRPTVKSALEQLRSTLEYSAYGLYERHCKGSMSDKDVYFPYSLKLAGFNRRVEECLKGLQHACPGAVDAVKSVQPFVCGDSWLSSLCNQTNFRKHKGLGEFMRRNSAKSELSIGNAIRSSGGGTTIGRLFVDGKLLNPGGPIQISTTTSRDELKSQLRKDSQHLVTQEFEYVNFLFAGTADDTLELIGKAHDRITAYAEAVKPYL
jgi:hypothetical protein